jgi:hypothetical protein
LPSLIVMEPIWNLSNPGFHDCLIFPADVDDFLMLAGWWSRGGSNP